MFAVLRIKSGAPEGIFGRFLHRIKKHRIKAGVVKTAFGSYLLLEAESDSINWRKAEYLCGRACRRVVMPPGIAPPPGFSIMRFEPYTFKSRVLLNTCAELIRRCKLPLYRKIVTLVDKNADYMEYVPTLLCHCITVRVVTQSEGRYNRLSDKMMEELGAGIIVTGSLGDTPDAGGSVMIICPDGGEAAELCASAPVFTLGGIDVPSRAQLVGDLQVKASGQLYEALPHGISAADFAGALYELCGWQDGGKLAANTMRCKENTLKLCDIIKYLERQAGC